MKPAYRPSTQPNALQRRSVLGAIGAAGTAAVAASLIAARRQGDGAAVDTPPPPAGTDPPRGYRLSEHVQRYYRSARA